LIDLDNAWRASERFVKVCKCLERSAKVWKGMERFEMVWIGMRTFGQVWIGLDMHDSFGWASDEFSCERVTDQQSK
jgi:hypothetical protein